MTQRLSKLINWLGYPTWLLVLYALVIRILYIKDHVIPFTFDHGKDSLAIMHMVLTFSPKLIGPWTSIPGLYFGPAWYYLLAPFMWLFRFQPIGAVVPMVLLVLCQIVLAKRYFGFWPALIMATTPTWVILSKSAWNPFPMTCVSLVLLIVFAQWQKTHKLSLGTSFVAGLVASLGFHFSTAFAIFYLPITVILILVKRFKLTLKTVLVYLLGFGLPFMPQLLFEWKYNFGQVRAIINYVQHLSGGETSSINKLQFVVKSIFNEGQLAVVPELFPHWLSITIGYVILMLVIYMVWSQRKRQNSQLNYWILVSAIFLGVSLTGFWFLHFNTWYLLGLFPVLVVLFGQALSRLNRQIQIGLVILYLISPAWGLARYFMYDRPHLVTQQDFLPIQIRVVDRIYQLAAGRPFAVYHYIPAIYDFSYQYLYLQRAYAQGSVLPVDFAYEPDVPAYYQGKSEMIAAIGQIIPAVIVDVNKSPEIVFYVIEKPQVNTYLEAWWGRQKYSRIVGEEKISDKITIYMAEP